MRTFNADMDGTVHMKLEGDIAKINVKIEPKTCDIYISYDFKVNAMMYVQLKILIHNPTDSTAI